MNKKLVFGVLAVVIAGVALYNMSSGPVETTEVGEDGETKSSGGIFSKAVNGILPGNTSKPNLDRLEESPHVVVINQNGPKTEVEDVIEGIEARLEQKSQIEGNQAIDYARWATFSEQYTSEERTRIYESAIELLQPEDAQTLSRDVLYSGRAPELYEKALQHATRDLNQKQLEELIRELLPRTTNPTLKSQLTDFAATRNIYVR